MHPRSRPSACSDTNAPCRTESAGSEGGAGGAARPTAASRLARASRSKARRAPGARSGAAMVRLPAPDGVGAIQLLVEDHARHFVREGERRQAPHLLGPLEHRLRQRLRTPDRERHVPAVHVPAAGPLGELGGRPLIAAARQRDEARALGYRREDPRLVLHLPLLDPRVVPQPIEVLVTGRPERRVPEAAHRDDPVAHQAYIPRSRCMAATRSTASMYAAVRVLTLCFSASAATSRNDRTMMLSSRRFTVSSSQKYAARSCTHSK